MPTRCWFSVAGLVATPCLPPGRLIAPRTHLPEGTCDEPKIEFIVPVWVSRYSRGLRSDTIAVDMPDAPCLLPAALSCLRYQVLEEKHDSAQPKASAHCSDIFCADMCARVLHVCESWIRAA